MKDELERRASKTRAVLALFQSKPLRWIDVHELGKVGGFAAWRTRVADARRILEKQFDGTIQWNGNNRESAYMFVPWQKLGRDAGDPVSQKSLF